MSKVAERKAKLRVDLTEAAERQIVRSGVHNLRARELAEEVGCSLGAIYNVFDDIDALVLHVSLRTLSKIDMTMAEALKSVEDAAAVEQMVQLAFTYCDFVIENTNLWKALFDHDFPADYELPEWIYQGQDILFRHIEKPLSDVTTDETAANLSLNARTLFSAVHGIVMLAVDQRSAGVPLDKLKPQLAFFVRTFVLGLEKSQR